MPVPVPVLDNDILCRLDGRDDTCSGLTVEVTSTGTGHTRESTTGKEGRIRGNRNPEVVDVTLFLITTRGLILDRVFRPKVIFWFSYRLISSSRVSTRPVISLTRRVPPSYPTCPHLSSLIGPPPCTDVAVRCTRRPLDRPPVLSDTEEVGPTEPVQDCRRSSLHCFFCSV